MKNNLSAVTLTLIDSGKELLKPFHPKIQKEAQKQLRKKKVALIMGVKVSLVEEGKINLSNDISILSNTIIWAAGVKSCIPNFFERDLVIVSGRLQVNQYLMMENQKDIFVLGDTSGFLNKNKVLVPMLAQVAVSQAKIVAYNIISSIKNKPLKPFIYRSKGNLISLGRFCAAGEINGIVIHGKIAWFIWRTVYLSTFASWKKRIQIAFEWTIDLFYPRDITKLT